MSIVYRDVKGQNTEFGSNIRNTYGVILINVFENQNRSYNIPLSKSIAYFCLH